MVTQRWHSLKSLIQMNGVYHILYEKKKTTKSRFKKLS